MIIFQTGLWGTEQTDRTKTELLVPKGREKTAAADTLNKAHQL